MKELALVGSDVDGGKSGVRVGLDRFVERLIGMDKSVCEVAVDGGPEILIHMVMRIKASGCAGKLRFGGGLVREDASVFVDSFSTRSRDASWFGNWFGFDGGFGFGWSGEGADGQ
jgi:hypothetical protein